MYTYAHTVEKFIPAPPEKVFAVLSDIAHHDKLAGSGEVKAIRVLTPGEVHVGTEWEADEEITIGKRTDKFVAKSVVQEYDEPVVLSWTSAAPIKPAPKRIQWWYHLTPEGTGTRVSEHVEVDMGSAMNLLLKVPYQMMRGPAVAAGMQRTLDNLAEEASTTSD